jgi:UDP-glucose 4-epimerase
VVQLLADFINQSRLGRNLRAIRESEVFAASVGVEVSLWKAAIFAFAAALANNEAPEFFGSGKQTRDFVFVEDVVDAYVKAATKGDGLVINIGTGVQTSIAALWKEMSAGSTLQPVVGKQRPSDITRFAVSPVRARIQLAWAPFTSLSEGVATISPPR